jgi:hypothetical protein
MAKRALRFLALLEFPSTYTFYAIVIATAPLMVWLGATSLLSSGREGHFGGFILLPGPVLATLTGYLGSLWINLGNLFDGRKLKIVVQVVVSVASVGFLMWSFVAFNSFTTNIIVLLYMAAAPIMFLGWISRQQRDKSRLEPQSRQSQTRAVATSLPFLGLAFAAIATAVSVTNAFALSRGNSFEVFLLMLPLWLCYGAASGIVAQHVWQLMQRRPWPRLVSALTTGLSACLVGTFATAMHVSTVLYTPFLETTIISACALVAAFTIHALVLSKHYPVRAASQREERSFAANDTGESSAVTRFLAQSPASEE